MVHGRVSTSTTQRRELLGYEGEFLKVPHKKKKNPTHTVMTVWGDAQDLNQDENSPPAV